MSQDARFEEANEYPLNLGAFDQENLEVVSSLLQDAVLPVTEISWRPRQRRLVLLVNRFRWEEKDKAIAEGRPFERVQSLFLVENVLSMSSQSINRKNNNLVLSLLSLDVQTAKKGDLYLLITFAGEGFLRARVEAIEVTLKDVTRPYKAQSSQTPKHP